MITAPVVLLIIIGWLFVLVAVFLGGWISLKSSGGRSLLSRQPSGDACNLEDIFEPGPPGPPEMPKELQKYNDRFQEQFDPGLNIFDTPPAGRMSSSVSGVPVPPVEDEHGNIVDVDGVRQ